MDDDTLTLLVSYGEDTKVEYKRTLQIKSRQDKAGRAALVLDVIGMANSQGEETGRILIGVDAPDSNSDDRIHDVSQPGLDDALLHDILDEYITSRVNFNYRTCDHKGRRIEVIEIPPSDARFHFVAIDLHDSEGKLLTY